MTIPPKLFAVIVLAWFAVPMPLLAKRIPAPVIEPIVYEGVRYTVPNDKGNRGYVMASDAGTGRLLWKKTVFRKCICPFLEHDVQWVFLKQMRLDAGQLILTNERGRTYSLDLKTRRVKKLNRPSALSYGFHAVQCA